MTETLPGATQTLTIPVEPPAGLAAAPVEAGAWVEDDPLRAAGALEASPLRPPAGYVAGSESAPPKPTAALGD